MKFFTLVVLLAISAANFATAEEFPSENKVNEYLKSTYELGDKKVCNYRAFTGLVEDIYLNVPWEISLSKFDWYFKHKYKSGGFDRQWYRFSFDNAYTFAMRHMQNTPESVEAISNFGTADGAAAAFIKSLNRPEKVQLATAIVFCAFNAEPLLIPK